MAETVWGPDALPHALEEFDTPAVAWTTTFYGATGAMHFEAQAGGASVAGLRMLRGLGT